MTGCHLSFWNDGSRRKENSQSFTWLAQLILCTILFFIFFLKKSRFAMRVNTSSFVCQPTELFIMQQSIIYKYKAGWCMLPTMFSSSDTLTPARVILDYCTKQGGARTNTCTYSFYDGSVVGIVVLDSNMDQPSLSYIMQHVQTWDKLFCHWNCFF